MKRLSSSRVAWSVLVVAAGAIGAGCGNSSPNTESSFDAGGDTGHHSDGGGKKPSPDGGGALHGTDSGGGSGDAACAATKQKADVAPLDMYIVLDRSGSMAENNSWSEEVQALTEFVYDTSSTGIGVGIQYMPLTQLCDPSAYATPAVPIAPLPQNQGPIATSLSNSRPFGGTPTVPALEGAIALGKQRQAQNPEREYVIVLSTDGVPDESCSFAGDGGVPNSTQNAIDVLQAAAAANPPIHTFVIGVGNEPALNAFAAAGGTGQAILVGAGDAGTAVDIETPLIAALNAIRTNALPCQYNIPQASMGMIDFGKVNVTFTPGSGSGEPLYGVANAAACTSGSIDWYYDDPSNPKHIELCPNACTAVKASTNGEVDVSYGCTTIGPPK